MSDIETMTVDQLLRNIKVYCRTTGKNLALSPNTSELVEIGFWEGDGTLKGKLWCEEGNAWYEQGQGCLPGDLASHLDDDDAFFAACVSAYRQGMQTMLDDVRGRYVE